MEEKERENDKKAKRFVSEVLQKLQSNDTRFRAELTRADNPATEMQAWPVLAKYCKLETKSQRLSFALIGACMARVRAEEDGTQKFGEALRMCKENPADDDDRIERKLRRILACDDTLELVQVLRPILRFVVSQGNVSLNYENLLKEILRFNEEKSREYIKLCWASQYYNTPEKEEEACTSPE